jgi:deoxyribonuclease V
MIAALDVHYHDPSATAAAVWFAEWAAAAPVGEATVLLPQVAPYEPGAFYRRELPCLLAVLRKVPGDLAAVVIDGYVWLNENQPGLGAHLYQALGSGLPVIGVAKTPFHGADQAYALLRGTSRQPLRITAAGLPLEEAVAAIAGMHGESRIPTLLKRVDRLARGG